MRLIDANELLEIIAEQERWNVSDFVYESIKNAPTIDAVEVVRCIDCKYFQCNMRPDGSLPLGVDEYECRHWCGYCDPMNFCSYGERREE